MEYCEPNWSWSTLTMAAPGNVCTTQRQQKPPSDKTQDSRRRNSRWLSVKLHITALLTSAAGCSLAHAQAAAPSRRVFLQMEPYNHTGGDLAHVIVCLGSLKCAKTQQIFFGQLDKYLSISQNVKLSSQGRIPRADTWHPFKSHRQGESCKFTEQLQAQFASGTQHCINTGKLLIEDKQGGSTRGLPTSPGQPPRPASFGTHTIFGSLKHLLSPLCWTPECAACRKTSQLLAVCWVCLYFSALLLPSPLAVDIAFIDASC